MDSIKKMYDVRQNPVRLVLFNIITTTVLVLGIAGFIIMVVGDYGEGQMPALLLTYAAVGICIFIANYFKKLNLAAIIIVSIVTFFLFPWMYFSGGAINGGMPIYFTLGMTFVFLLCEGATFYVLLILQIAIYSGCLLLSYLHPEWVTPLGDTRDVYLDIYQAILIVSIVLGLINKFEIGSYENLIKEEEIQNKALKESEKRAENANRAKSDFLSSMSHEIRTPINAIIGMNEVIRREAKDDDIKSYAEIINTSATALLSIINDILDFSRIESGKMTIIEEKYELYSLINDCYNMVIDRAEDKGLALVVDCDEDLPVFLRGDLIRIRQIITNLLTNAVKYTEAGKVTMKITGHASADNIDLIVSVIDTGIGMKEEELSKLFEKFERLDVERNQTVEGSGLGLTIVKSLVDVMNGAVSVNSTYGKGSTFTVTIPQKIEGEEKIGKVKFGGVSKKRLEKIYTPSIIEDGSRVLVVDDVQMNLLVFKKLIKDTKIQVDTAISGEECLQKIRDVRYDAIFMDHMMPGMNGIEVFEAMQADSTHKNVGVPVVMLTANAIAGMEEEYLSKGFAGYISKPIDVNKLENMLRTIINADKKDKEADDESGESDMASDAAENGAKEAADETLTETGLESADEAEATAEMESEIPAVNSITEGNGMVECNVDINAGIENCGGSKEFYEEIIGSFIEEGKEKELAQNYADKDWEMYTINVHSIKGTLRLIGAMDAGEVAETLQFAGEKKDTDTIDALHDQLLKMIDISLGKIKEQL